MINFIPDRIIYSKVYYGIFYFHSNEGWIELSFLGRFDSHGAADRALIKYTKQLKNKSTSKERYQIRVVTTTYHALSEFEWNPDKELLCISNLRENLTNNKG